MTDMTRRMLTINLASAYRHLDKEDDANRVLDSEDWSASSTSFVISVAALRGDIDEVLRLFDRAVGDGALINEHAFRDWPIFDYVRDEPRFRDKFFEAFGASLSGSAVSADAEDSDPPDESGTPEGD